MIPQRTFIILEEGYVFLEDEIWYEEVLTKYASGDVVEFLITPSGDGVYLVMEGINWLPATP